MLTSTEQAELIALAHWITRCASIPGPVGTRGYLIKPEVMYRLTELIETSQIA